MEMIKTQCNKCGQKINPYLLKQVGYEKDVLTFEVECVKCREYNYMSLETYLIVKKDYLMPKLRPINFKLPSEMNVIIVSMGRCGISWIVRKLSGLHAKMFGKPIKLITEFSPLIATRNRFPIPKGWINIYNEDPQRLLDRIDPLGNKYDKVLIVQRGRRIMELVHEFYYPINASEDFIKRSKEKEEENYKKVYGKVINDPRCLCVDLEDLNNYTDASFHKIMNFFNFPSEGRPEIFPLPVSRDWEAFSSILDKDQPLCKRLERISQYMNVTKEGILEFMIKQKRKPRRKKIELNNVVVLGPRIHKGCHFSENIYYAFKEKGINATMVPLEDLMEVNSKEWLLYRSRTKAYHLSQMLEKLNLNPELIVIDEPAFTFYNDLQIPVFYVHREYKRPPTVFYPDIAFFWHDRVTQYFKTLFAPHWAAQIPQFDVMPIAVDLKRFKFDKRKKKKYKGLTILAGRETIKNCLLMNELTAVGCLNQLLDNTKRVMGYGVRYIEDPEGGLTDERFRKLLPQCEAIWIELPARQYVSRRILEGMICKTLVVIRLENKEHEAILANMGLYKDKHYVSVDNLEDVKELNDNWDFSEYKDVISLAHKTVVENHTFSNRVDFIIEKYKDIVLRRRGVLIGG